MYTQTLKEYKVSSAQKKVNLVIENTNKNMVTKEN